MELKTDKKQNAIIYQSKTGAIELRGDFDCENIWATKKQIGGIFNIDRSVVSRHIKNIFKDGEMNSKVGSAKFAHTTKHGAIKGKTQIRQVEMYSLDIILAVGYRTNSKKAVEFRKWATKVLKNYLTQGYVLNRKQIVKNYNNFLQSISDVQNLLPQNIKLDAGMVLELVKEFAGTWTALGDYDKNKLKIIGSDKKSIEISEQELVDAINEFRLELIKKKEASRLFAQEKKAGNIAGILGNILQSFGGKSVYATVEEKAAHLLYFMVKNHPFNDGNKRSGAFAFVWFLRKMGVRGMYNINPGALTALTLLIAESNPKQKNQMTALITNLLAIKK